MKLLLALCLCFSLNAFADHHEEDMDKKIEGMSFEEAKKMRLEHIDMMMKNMQDHRSCVNDAKDKEGMKACRKKMKEERKEMKEMHQKMKDKMKDMKKKK